MILTRCRDGGTEDPCCSARCDWPLPTPVDTRPANAERLGYLGGAPSVGILSLAPQCETEMVITRITPILFGGAFKALSLACKKCGFTKKLRVERS